MPSFDPIVQSTSNTTVISGVKSDQVFSRPNQSQAAIQKTTRLQKKEFEEVLKKSLEASKSLGRSETKGGDEANRPRSCTSSLDYSSPHDISSPLDGMMEPVRTHAANGKYISNESYEQRTKPITIQRLQKCEKVGQSKYSSSTRPNPVTAFYELTTQREEREKLRRTCDGIVCKKGRKRKISESQSTKNDNCLHGRRTHSDPMNNKNGKAKTKSHNRTLSDSALMFECQTRTKDFSLFETLGSVNDVESNVEDIMDCLLNDEMPPQTQVSRERGFSNNSLRISGWSEGEGDLVLLHSDTEIENESAVSIPHDKKNDNSNVNQNSSTQRIQKDRRSDVFTTQLKKNQSVPNENLGTVTATSNSRETSNIATVSNTVNNGNFLQTQPLVSSSNDQFLTSKRNSFENNRRQTNGVRRNSSTLSNSGRISAPTHYTNTHQASKRQRMSPQGISQHHSTNPNPTLQIQNSLGTKCGTNSISNSSSVTPRQHTTNVFSDDGNRMQIKLLLAAIKLKKKQSKEIISSKGHSHRNSSEQLDKIVSMIEGMKQNGAESYSNPNPNRLRSSPDRLRSSASSVSSRFSPCAEQFEEHLSTDEYLRKVEINNEIKRQTENQHQPAIDSYLRQIDHKNKNLEQRKESNFSPNPTQRKESNFQSKQLVLHPSVVNDELQKIEIENKKLQRQNNELCSVRQKDNLVKQMVVQNEQLKRQNELLLSHLVNNGRPVSPEFKEPLLLQYLEQNCSTQKNSEIPELYPSEVFKGVSFSVLHGVKKFYVSGNYGENMFSIGHKVSNNSLLIGPLKLQKTAAFLYDALVFTDVLVNTAPCSNRCSCCCCTGTCRDLMPSPLKQLARCPKCLSTFGAFDFSHPICPQINRRYGECLLSRFSSRRNFPNLRPAPVLVHTILDFFRRRHEPGNEANVGRVLLTMIDNVIHSNFEQEVFQRR